MSVLASISHPEIPRKAEQTTATATRRISDITCNPTERVSPTAWAPPDTCSCNGKPQTEKAKNIRHLILRRNPPACGSPHLDTDQPSLRSDGRGLNPKTERRALASLDMQRPPKNRKLADCTSSGWRFGSRPHYGLESISDTFPLVEFRRLSLSAVGAATDSHVWSRPIMKTGMELS